MKLKRFHEESKRVVMTNDDLIQCRKYVFLLLQSNQSWAKSSWRARISTCKKCRKPPHSECEFIIYGHHCSFGSPLNVTSTNIIIVLRRTEYRARNDTLILPFLAFFELSLQLIAFAECLLPLPYLCTKAFQCSLNRWVILTQVRYTEESKLYLKV